MNSIDKINKIPAEVMFYVDSSKPGNEAAVAVLSTDATESMKSKIKWDLHRNPAAGDKLDRYNVYKIQNEGFRFSIPDSSITICEYSSKMNLRIESQSITDTINPSKSLILQVNTSQFLKLIQENNISISSSGKISGEYSITWKNDQDIWIIPDDSSDKNSMLARKIGKDISTKKGTSSWIPGHMYYLKQSKRYILYLGDIKDFVIPTNYYYYSKNYELQSSWMSNTSQYSLKTVQGKLFLYVNPIEIINNSPNNLRDLLTNCITNFCSDDRNTYPLVVRDSTSSKLSGVDLGEIIQIDGPLKEQEAEMIIKNLCYQKLNNVSSHDEARKYQRIASFIFPKILKDNQFYRDNFISSCKRAWVNATKYSGTKAVKTIEDLMDKSITAYVPSLFDKSIIDITDDELEKLKKEVFNCR